MVRVGWLKAPEKQLVHEIEVDSIRIAGGQQECGGKHVGVDHATGMMGYESIVH